MPINIIQNDRRISCFYKLKKKSQNSCENKAKEVETPLLKIYF